MTMKLPDVVMRFEVKALGEPDFVGNRMALVCTVYANERKLGGAAVSYATTPEFTYPEVQNAYMRIAIRHAIDDVLENSTIIEGNGDHSR